MFRENFKGNKEQAKQRKQQNSWISKRKSHNNSFIPVLSSSKSSNKALQRNTTSDSSSRDMLPRISVPLLLVLAVGSLQVSVITGDLGSSSRSAGGWDVWWAYDGIAGKSLFDVSFKFLKIHLITRNGKSFKMSVIKCLF